MYTTDGWATTKTAPAYYQRTFQNGLELWTASPVLSVYQKGSSNNTYAQSVEYALSYSVSGVTYWDNNSGQNYRINIGQIIE